MPIKLVKLLLIIIDTNTDTRLLTTLQLR